MRSCHTTVRARRQAQAHTRALGVAFALAAIALTTLSRIDGGKPARTPRLVLGPSASASACEEQPTSARRANSNSLIRGRQRGLMALLGGESGRYMGALDLASMQNARRLHGGQASGPVDSSHLNRTQQVVNMTRTNPIVVFSSSYCPFCREALQILRTVDYGRTTVVEADDDLKRILATLTGQRTVPNVWIGGKFVGGCGDGPEPWMGVKKLHRSGELKIMIDKALSK